MVETLFEKRMEIYENLDRFLLIPGAAGGPSWDPKIDKKRSRAEKWISRDGPRNDFLPTFLCISAKKDKEWESQR